MKKILLSIIILLITFIVCICIGSVTIPVSEVYSMLANTGNYSASNLTIITKVRIPRVLLAMLVGASLSTAGATMQGMLKNPLADGSILGVTSGGSLGAIIALIFGFSVIPFGIGFSFLSLLIILAFSYKIDSNLSSNTIILTGIIFSMFVSSLTTLLITFSGDKFKNVVFWSMGSFANSDYKTDLIVLIFVIIGVVISLSYKLELDALTLGEDQASYVGVNVKTTKIMLLISIAILCGTSVSVAGNVAFVGLIVPHMVRIIYGSLHKTLLPICIIWGAIFTAICDLIARTILSPIELPIGVITSIIGSVVFATIFIRGSNND